MAYRGLGAPFPRDVCSRPLSQIVSPRVIPDRNTDNRSDGRGVHLVNSAGPVPLRKKNRPSDPRLERRGIVLI